MFMQEPDRVADLVNDRAYTAEFSERNHLFTADHA